ncbi:MAG: adenylate/guanylate cyclase domain-containing protein [Coleofasciculaceae cyanobacterium]
MMHIQDLSTECLLLKIEKNCEELEVLKQDKIDLEVLLETTLAHADAIEIELHESNQKLQSEIIERQLSEAKLQLLTDQLQCFLAKANKDKEDLEIILETTTEHGDLVGNLLHAQADATKRASERNLAQFLEAVPVGVRVINAKGEPYYSNRIANQILGEEGVSSSTYEDLTKVCQIFIAGTNQRYPVDQFPGAHALKGESTSVDNLELRKGDQVIFLEAWGTPIFDEKGNIAYAIVAFQDISQRKQSESERQKFTDELFNINEALSRFVPRQFLQFLNKKSIVDVAIGDQVQQEMSVLFADIRNFTGLSETMTPQENFNFINAYLSRMEPAVIENQGFIDKYIGDEIMALFSGGVDNAVKAGISMLKRLTEYNQYRAKSDYVQLKIGIGINTGSLMLGTVGGTSRMDSTVISDSVNLASRIEKLTRHYGTSLLISHHAFFQLEDASLYAFRMIDRLKVRGKLETVSIYEIFDAEEPELYQGKLATKLEFEQALLLYHLGAYKDAAQLFGHCLFLNPNDTVAQIYRKLCQKRLD